MNVSKQSRGSNIREAGGVPHRPTRKDPVAAEEEEKFQHFLFEMDDVLEALVNEAEARGVLLDYSLESLDRLEEYWDSRKGDPDAQLLFQRCARYFGEVFRVHTGGTWKLFFDTPKHLYHKLPVIDDYGLKPVPMCPLAVFNNYVRGGRQGLLKSLTRSSIPRGRNKRPEA